MTIEEILSERIRLEIDIEVLEELGEKVGADFTEQLKDMEIKYKTMLERKFGKLTDKDIHLSNDL